jgi:adenine-specific DNA methylase
MYVKSRPRLLIEDWLPAAALSVECMRERGSPTALAPTTYLHVWWARRPLTVCRAAILGSLLPSAFPRDIFERLLGFGKPSEDLIALRRIMDTGVRLGGFGCGRAFTHPISSYYFEKLHEAVCNLWGEHIVILDPMAGGGSIPFESIRMGFRTLANEYNPVACVILEATLDYPFSYGPGIVEKARYWANIWRDRYIKRVGCFFPKSVLGGLERPDGYIFARVVPCPDTGFLTPLVPDWHLSKPKNSAKTKIIANPIVYHDEGIWEVQIREIGNGAGQLRQAPKPTYSNGKGISLFTGRPISAEYIKAMAQQGRMESVLYALPIKTPQGLKFQVPEKIEQEALSSAERELKRLLPIWEKSNIIPTEEFPKISSDPRPRLYGMPRWSDMFTPRQLLSMGVLVEELQTLRKEIITTEGDKIGETIIHLIALIIDKFANYNSVLSTWHSQRTVLAPVFEKHDYSFKTTYTEMATCGEKTGLAWAITNVLKAYRELSQLPQKGNTVPVQISMGSATNLPYISDSSITAVIVDPPYADNVQYSELADFFYVWLKRTQGHRRPEWFSTYLCDHSQEAVVNVSRSRNDEEPIAEARKRSHTFYQRLMTETFSECHRILRDDGVLTVMFTHKKQEAWESLFNSLIEAGFTITATWPVKTESEHSLHQARKNAAQSTVILVSRKRLPGAGVGYFDARMQDEIRQAARKSAERLKNEGLNAIDQLVGSFGPAIEVFSRYDEVRTDVGDKVSVAKAIDEASDAISRWRIEQLAAKGLEGVEPEGQFYLLCWDVLGAAEFRYNEAHLLGKAVGMDVDQMVAAGLVTKSGDKIKILSARERRRERALEPNEVEELIFGTVVKEKKRTKKDVRKVHPNDPQFFTALDACHALALRYIEAKGGSGGIGSAKALTRQQGWTKDSPVAKLMEALVIAAPEAVRFEKGKKSTAALFPEFRAWHELLPALFGIAAPEWKEKQIPQGMLAFHDTKDEENIEESKEESDESGNDT